MTVFAVTSKLYRHIQLLKALAFTRNPSDTDVSPATYTADGASDLILVAQSRDISIDGSDEDDNITATAAGLAANALYNYNVRGFEGEDTIRIDAALIQNSVINGNADDDRMILGNGGIDTSVQFNDSYFLGGKGDDVISAFDLNGGEVNGNIGDDRITIDNIDNAGFNQYVGGGQGNDRIVVLGDYTDSIIDGNKGIDTIIVEDGVFSGTSVNGGEGDDILRNQFGFNAKGLNLNGDLGDDTIVSVGLLGSDISGGEGDDTLVSAALFGESSTVDGGVGADFIDLLTPAQVGIPAFASLAKETIIFNAGDSNAATASSLGFTPGAPISGTITFKNGVDQITNFVSGTDKIDIDFSADAIVDATLIPNTDNTFKEFIYEVQGNFANNVFTTDAAGADFLYMVGGPNVPLGASFTNSTNIFISNGEELFIGDFV